MQRSIESYEMWRKELIKDLAFMKQVYLKHDKFKDMEEADVM